MPHELSFEGLKKRFAEAASLSEVIVPPGSRVDYILTSPDGLLEDALETKKETSFKVGQSIKVVDAMSYIVTVRIDDIKKIGSKVTLVGKVIDFR